jgi:hypothetical protein
MIDTRVSPNRDATLGFGPWTVQIWNADGVYVNPGAINSSIIFQDDIFSQLDDDNTISILRSTICVSYANWYNGIDLRSVLDFDAQAKTAQAFSMMAMILALSLLVAASLPCCCAIGKRGFVFLGFTSIFTAFASLMTLIMKDSSLCNKELGCQYGWSAWFSVTAGVMWVVIGAVLIGISGTEARSRPTAFVPHSAYPPAYEAYPAAEVVATGHLETTEETTRHHNADGTVTVVHRTIVHNPDGSKTVTETSHDEAWQP